MKKYLVIGLGNFGFNVAVTLYELGNDVVVIDLDKKKIDQIKDLVTHAIVGDATDKEMLEEIVTDSLEAVIVALGTNMEASILTTLHLKDLGVKRVISKAVSEDHGKILKAIGAHQVVYPEKDSAIRIAKELSNPNMIDHLPLAPEYSIVTIATPSKFIGRTLKEIQLRNKYGVEVIAVKDALTDTLYLIPEADFKLGPDSILIIIGEKDNIDRISALK